jgi:hypothetical protein
LTELALALEFPIQPEDALSKYFYDESFSESLPEQEIAGIHLLFHDRRNIMQKNQIEASIEARWMKIICPGAALDDYIFLAKCMPDLREYIINMMQA